MTKTGNTLAVVDRHVGYEDKDGYRIDLVARDDAGHRVRVRVLHSIMARQSYAVAEVLAADLTWTNLATESPSNWYEGIPNRFWEPSTGKSPEELVFGRQDLTELPPEQHKNGPAIVAALQKVADGLLDRAAAILSDTAGSVYRPGAPDLDEEGLIAGPTTRTDKLRDALDDHDHQ